MSSGARKRSDSPRITVLLPVHNGERYLGDAIASVLAQTLTDFELVVVDDGSTDRTAEILSGVTDGRLRVIRNEKNAGIAAALNAGIRASQAEFLARMDADDICDPRRLERQAAYLEAHPEVSICGTWYRAFGARRVTGRPPLDHERICAAMCFGWAIAHPTILMRRDFLKREGLSYDESFRESAEDIEFLLRAADLTRLANVPEFLYFYRLHEGQMSAESAARRQRELSRALARPLRALTPGATESEKALHAAFGHRPLSLGELAQAEEWLLKLLRANEERRVYEGDAFRAEVRHQWHGLHVKAQAGFGALYSYWKSELSGAGAVPFRAHAWLALQCVVQRPSWKRALRDAFERATGGGKPPAKSGRA